MQCALCRKTAEVNITRPLCGECFLKDYESRIRRLIQREKLITPRDRILVAVSGGKDSLSCAQVLHTLGYPIAVLHVDVGVAACTNPRTRNVVERFCEERDIPFYFLSFSEYLGVDMDEFFHKARRPRCATCGMLKRYVFNRFARENGFTKLATGHCADDVARYLLKAWVSGSRESFLWLEKLKPLTPSPHPMVVARIRPLFFSLEQENYAYTKLRGIVVAGCTMCSFFLRKDSWTEMLHRIEEVRRDFALAVARTLARQPEKGEANDTFQECQICGEPTSGEICAVCRVRERCLSTHRYPKSSNAPETRCDLCSELEHEKPTYW
jgi:tRNA(Ile)-lysidine synthase TilS/MesJ